MGGSQPTIPAQRCARAAAATCRIQSQSSLALSRSACWERMRRMACSAPVVREVCTLVTFLQVYFHPSYTQWQLARPPCSRTGPTHSRHPRLNCWIPAPAKLRLRWQHGCQIAQAAEVAVARCSLGAHAAQPRQKNSSHSSAQKKSDGADQKWCARGRRVWMVAAEEHVALWMVPADGHRC